ncbi:uncharacterized protein VTP21DRAFT_3571 [Calcarisporiella thermophila]|uniref:uncharacterized protein n=1 Tax=Calcarisporiella thermophila TaxID=911321 RepID=UPI003744A7E5
MADLDYLFQNAVERINSAKISLSSDAKLQLYALYKQATVGPNTTPRPGLFDIVGRAKWDSWKKCSLSQDEAKSSYVSLVNDWIGGNQEAQGREEAGSEQGSGARFSLANAVSKLADEEDEHSDEPKDIFYYVKQGDVKEAERLLEGRDLNEKDAQGLSLLHWACDRGHAPMVEMLLARGADVDIRDEDGQSPLHYACMAENLTLAKILVSNRGDLAATDHEGTSALELCPTESMRKALQSSSK